jgi:hypothetical protein
MKLKDDFFEQGSFIIGNGVKDRFWKDTWLGNLPLAQQYPSLYNNTPLSSAVSAVAGIKAESGHSCLDSTADSWSFPATARPRQRRNRCSSVEASEEGDVVVQPSQI